MLIVFVSSFFHFCFWVFFSLSSQVFVLIKPFSFVKQTCFSNHCLTWKPKTSLTSTKQKRLNVGKINAQKKTQQKSLLSLANNSSSTLTFFEKEITESWFENKQEIFLVFVSSFAQNKGFKRQIVLALLLNKNILVWSKNYQIVFAVFCPKTALLNTMSLPEKPCWRECEFSIGFSREYRFWIHGCSRTSVFSRLVFMQFFLLHVPEKNLFQWNCTEDFFCFFKNFHLKFWKA